MALTSDGTVYTWGNRAYLNPHAVEWGYADVDVDAAGDGADGQPSGGKASKAASTAGVRLVGSQVSCGDGVCGVVDRDGRLYTWGKNLATGMLGHAQALYGAGTRRPALVGTLAGPLSSPPRYRVAKVSFGSKHAAAITV